MTKEKELESIPDLLHEVPYSIRIEVKSIGLEITIIATNPLDCIILAGYVLKKLQEMDKEPTVVILP